MGRNVDAPDAAQLLDRVEILERDCFGPDGAYVQERITNFYGPGSWEECRNRFVADVKNIGQQLAVVALRLGADSTPFDRVALGVQGLGRSDFVVARQSLRTRLAAGLRPTTSGDGGAAIEQNTTDDSTLDARAVAMKFCHPEWTDQQIADAIGCSRQTLFKRKMIKYRQAKEAIKSGREEYRQPSPKSRDD